MLSADPVIATVVTKTYTPSTSRRCSIASKLSLPADHAGGPSGVIFLRDVLPHWERHIVVLQGLAMLSFFETRHVDKKRLKETQMLSSFRGFA